MPEVLEAVASEWVEEQIYAWGCCPPVRTVSITVINRDPDVWSWVELRARFPELEPQLELQRLDVGIGPGEHTLTFRQWAENDGALRPDCFEVVGVAASGQPSDGLTVCVDAGDVPIVEPFARPPPEPPPVAGCATAPAAGWLALALGLLGSRRRRSA